MDSAAYILGLLAIISGLAIADMVVSLHGLLANRRNVRWDWLTLVAAAFVFLLIVSSWGVAYRAFDDLPSGPWFWEFVLTLCQVIAVYLAARAILPDAVQLGQRVDLAAHYAFISRYFWASLSVTYAIFLSFALMVGGIASLRDQWAAAVALGAAVVLAIWSSRKLHRIVAPALLALLCASTMPERLLVG